MFPKSRGPPLPSSDAFSTGRIPFRSSPLPPPPPPPHPDAHVQNVQERGLSAFPKTSGVSLNIFGRLGQYRIEAATSDQLVPIMGQIFDAERQTDLQQNMWLFQQMMMTMNPALMNSPCSCLSEFQSCRGPQTDVSGPAPGTFRVGSSSTVGHSISGPGPNQCDPMPTRRRQPAHNQSGPYSSQLRSTSPTSAGAQLGSAVRQHDYDGVPVQSTYFHNSKLPATLISFYIAGETILEVPHPMFSQLFRASCRSQFFLHFFGREHGHPDRY